MIYEKFEKNSLCVDCKKNTSVARETRGTMGAQLQAPLKPLYDSALLVRGVSEWPQLRPHDAERRKTLGLTTLIVVVYTV